MSKAQLCSASRGETVLREVSTGGGCGFDIPVGKGRAVVITTAYRCDLDFWLSAFKVLGAAPAITHSSTDAGVSLGDEAVVAVDGRARCEGARSSYEGGRTILRVRRGEFTVRKG
ncbi:hypothetical protein [Streptomyces sp. NPDC056105]|uniref:hypothetical protein n=1 Tax=Streptomyces sp. NPDC056105 TaxID=3345714 RepID=UPI0035D69308